MADAIDSALENTVGKVPGGAGSAAVGAIEGAAVGSAVAGGVATAVGVATTVAAGVAAAAGSTAAVATAIGVGAAIGNAIPIPGIGAAIGAVIGALTAFGMWVSSGLRDTFQPSPEQAETWLALFEIMPSLVFLNVDKAVDPAQAAHLVRYLMVRSGRVKIGERRNNGQLYNPVSDFKCDNPYFCRVDPLQPLTDEQFIAPIYWEYVAHQRKGLPYTPAPVARTPEDAARVLTVLRKHGGSVKDWSQVTGNAVQIVTEVRALRLLAGEDGADKFLSDMLGGDVTVRQSSWLEGSWPWLIGGMALTAATVGVGVVSARRGDAKRSLPARREVR